MKNTFPAKLGAFEVELEYEWEEGETAVMWGDHAHPESPSFAIVTKVWLEHSDGGSIAMPPEIFNEKLVSAWEQAIAESRQE